MGKRKSANILEMRRAKRTKIWDSDGTNSTCMGYPSH